MKFDFTLHCHDIIFMISRDFTPPVAAEILGQNEGSDFITRPLLSDYENILCCHPLADEVCVGVDEADNPVVVFGILIADAS